MAQFIHIRKIDERGNVIKDSDLNFASINKILYGLDNFEKEFPVMSMIDPYGNTYFNRYQIPKLVNELKEFSQKIDDKETKDNIAKIIAFIGRTDEPHVFIKFIGD